MRKNFLLIITLALMCWGLFGTWAQGGRGPNIGFLKNPWITGPSGVYTKYTNQEGGVRWSPSKSDPTVAIHSEASGFGDVTSTLTDITIAGKPFSVSGSGTSIGSMQVVFGLPFSAESPWSYSSHGKSIPFIETPGTYKWSASGNVKLTPYVWEWDLGSGPNFTGDWVKKPELAKNEGALKTSGEWSVVHKAECIECKVTADTVADLSPDHDKVLCTAPGCNETYRKCKPGKHTSKPCPISITRDGGLVYCSIPAWECQPHNTHVFPASPSDTPPSGSNPPSGNNPPPLPTPTDDTPNCSDCTSHCSSPCSCSTSGTCNGTVTTPTPSKPKLKTCDACNTPYDPNSSSAHSHRSVPHSCGKHSYYACQTLSSSETNRHTYQTMPCGKHRYYPCRMTWIHKQTVSCPTKNGVACSYSSYYPCSPHTHSYPSANNNNNGNSGNGNSGNGNSGNSGNGNSGASAMRQCGNHTKAEGGDHSYNTCTHCNRGYWACSQWASRHTTQETCRRPGCGTTFYKCSNGTCVSKWGTRSSHWAR